jgi:hypothetical protein
MPAKNCSMGESLSRKSNQLASDKFAVVPSWKIAWLHDADFLFFNRSYLFTCLFYLKPLNFAVQQSVAENKLLLVTSK